MTFPMPNNEPQRLQALRSLSIAEMPWEASFDAVVGLACETFNVPVALISLLDEHVQWFKAAKGWNRQSTLRELALCNYPVASGEMLVVRDATRDDRFATNPLVVNEHLRFYAGLPISLDPGIHLGTICIIDFEPRRFSKREAHRLRQLAEIVNALLRQHRDMRELVRIASELERQGIATQQQAQKLDSSKRLFDRASALTRSGGWEWTPDSGELTWTDGMYDIHEVPRGSEISSQLIQSFYPEVARKKVDALVRKKDRLPGSRYSFEGPMYTARGKRRWIRLVGDVECESGAVVRCFGAKQDITREKAVRDQLQRLAEFDPLTGLLNRHMFSKKLRHLLRHTLPGTSPVVALLLVDVDGFKLVNDTFMHSAGDACLRQIARRLKRIPDDEGFVARMGGDEFALVLQVCDDGPSIEKRAEVVLKQLRLPVRWDGHSFQLSGSVGIAVAGDAGISETELFTQADLALYAAKGAGKNTYRTFTPAMKHRADAKFQTVRNISTALVQNTLELFYQPKVTLADDVLSGFEALLRWRLPEGQVIAAGAFAAAFDDPDLSGRIGEWVIRQALAQAQEWQRIGLDFGHIAINLTAEQFRDPNFGHRLIKMIEGHGLEPRMIEVEVTEGVLLQEGSAIKIMEALRASGVRIALDDFGTGFASLSHLRTYPVDIIKIDRSFVMNFLTSQQDHAILHSTLFLARHMKLDVVAEGIENVDQCEMLNALGCRYGQGWFFSKAVCASEASEWCISV